MFQNQNYDHSQLQSARPGILRTGALAVTAVVALSVSALPAAARPEQGPVLDRVSSVGPAGPAVHDNDCRLQRVGRQYVRCDDNTGNGVPAPSWIAVR